MRPSIYTVSHPGPGTLSTMAHPPGGALLLPYLHGLRRLEVDVLVSAQTDSERDECELSDQAALAEAAGLHFMCVPIEDRTAPLGMEVVEPVASIYALYRAGAHVVFHCWAGIGRSSLLAALLLGMDGVEPEAAWRLISAARGFPVPDTGEQEMWLADWWVSRDRPFHVEQ
ncbi:Protein-tyrosine phosphatase [Lentzea xinjiangensis]|uniref:Protein-tyrosine phosphatase n=1 Tax=Lentzea xinjiangensis TaxID=402600 RepID=A0A1H8ZZ77_9PSEU|nr:dual specificity protein phosphatase family protein [Lentzea xinjiangensis]SEP69048.1 Protein-tyrosine phosphatase [Lentzea xinjiangensis]